MIEQFLVQHVCLDALTKVFACPPGPPVRALSGLSLNVDQGECVALVGPSGSGKTTALRLIAGLEEPSSGTVAIGGTVINGLAPSRRDVAMVFQSPALYPHMTIYQNLAFGLRLRRCLRPEIDRQVREIAEMLGLSPLLEFKPMVLSAGQRQRVALGRAMVRRASVLLLDEPLANVDPTLRAQMRNEIAGIRRQFGTSMVYVTHDHLEAMMVGDRVAVLSQGVLQQIAAPATLYARPANLFVASFVGSPPMNLLPGALVRRLGTLFFEPSMAAAVASREPGVLFPIKPGAPSAVLPEELTRVVVGLRPEHIKCAAAVPGPAIRAQLQAVQTLGPDTYLTAACDGHQFVARGALPAGLSPGQECCLCFDLEHACFFDPGTGKALF